MNRMMSPAEITAIATEAADLNALVMLYGNRKARTAVENGTLPHLVEWAQRPDRY